MGDKGGYAAYPQLNTLLLFDHLATDECCTVQSGNKLAIRALDGLDNNYPGASDISPGTGQLE